MTDQKKKVLFVLSGGGMPGLDIHAGIWLALEEAGIYPTMISGTSAGAIVGAMMACGWHAHGAAEYLMVHKDDDFRHERPFWKVRLPWIESIHLSDRIEVCLDGCLPLEWSRMQIPFMAWACNKRNGVAVNVARPELAGRPAEAVLASMSISGLFPSVRLLDGEDYIDGGMRFNLPLPMPYDDYEEVYLFIAQPLPQDYRGSGVVTNLIRNLNILRLDQILDPLDQTRGDKKVHVLWPGVTGETSMLRFNHNLIDEAYEYTIKKLGKEQLL